MARISLIEPDDEPALHELVRSAWRLDELALEYRDFLERFGPLDELTERHGSPDPETCFGFRTLAC